MWLQACLGNQRRSKNGAFPVTQQRSQNGALAGGPEGDVFRTRTHLLLPPSYSLYHACHCNRAKSLIQKGVNLRKAARQTETLSPHNAEPVVSLQSLRQHGLNPER